jgi:hypothetical protein
VDSGTAPETPTAPRSVRSRRSRRTHLVVQIVGLTTLVLGVLPMLAGEAHAGLVNTANACTNALAPTPSQIPMTLQANDPASATVGIPLTVSGLQVTGNIPASFIQAGVGLGVLHDGQVVAGSISVVIHASDATVADTTLSGNANATIHAPGSPAVAQALVVIVSLGSHDWTPTASGTFTLSQGLTGTAGHALDAGSISDGSLLLSAVLPFGTVKIACKPGTVAGTTASFAASTSPFVSVTAADATTTTTGGGTTTTTGGGTTTTTGGGTTTTTGGGTTTTTDGATTTTAAPTTTTTTPVAVAGTLYGSCSASNVTPDPVGAGGLDQFITDSVTKGVHDSTYKFIVPATTTGTPGSLGTANYHTVLSYDFQSANQSQLINTVVPAAAKTSPTIAATAWLEQTFTNFSVAFPLPAGATIIGTPTATGTGAGAAVSAAASGGNVSVTLPKVKVGNYQTPVPVPSLTPVAPFTVALDFTVAIASATPPPVTANAATFGLDYVTGVNFLNNPSMGGASSTQTCSITSAAPPASTGPAGPTTTGSGSTLGVTSARHTLPVTGSSQSVFLLLGLALLLIDLGYLLLTATRPAGAVRDFLREARG